MDEVVRSDTPYWGKRKAVFNNVLEVALKHIKPPSALFALPGIYPYP